MICSCGECFGQILVPENYAGEVVICPHCARSIQLHNQSSHSEGPTVQTEGNGGLVATIFLAFVFCSLLAILSVGKKSETKTRVRAIGSISRLPLASSETEADTILFEYNLFNVPTYAIGCEECPSISFRGNVSIIETGGKNSKVRVEDGTKLIGWVPNDWLENYPGEVGRREEVGAKTNRITAESLLKLSKDQLFERLGKPLKVTQGSHPSDGDFEMFIFDETPGSEVFATIWKNDGFVSSANFKGQKADFYK